MIDTELYIHIPFCVRKCLYCDFLSGPFDADIRKRYTEALVKELRYQSAFMKDALIRSVYFGGGTPTLLEEAYFEKIISEVFRDFHMKDHAEISMECNPATASFDKLSHYQKLGVNRLSIGLQSASEKELKTLGRIHTFPDFLKTFDEARKAGFSNINVDLMTGIPGQSLDSLQNTLSQVTKLAPDHISCYSLIIEENTPFYQSYHEEDERRREGEPVEDLPSDSGLRKDGALPSAGDDAACSTGVLAAHLPSEDEEYALSKNARAFLISKGYAQYEISNYTKPGFECIHNIGYWQRVPYLGVGLGAASLLTDECFQNFQNHICQPPHNIISPYSQNNIQLDSSDGKWHETRYRNPSDMKKYIEKAEHDDFPIFAEKEKLTKKAAIEEFIFLGLRMNEGISIEKFKEAFGISLASVYHEQIRKFQDEKLLEISGERLKLTEKGMDVSNYVLSDFLLPDDLDV